MPTISNPLSSTASAVFEAFIKKLGEEQVLAPPELEALKESLMQQKLDPVSLRGAMFATSEPKK
jgi:hypothetical protein